MSGGLVAAEIGATPAQIALAWLLAQGGDITPPTQCITLTHVTLRVGGVVVAAAGWCVPGPGCGGG